MKVAPALLLSFVLGLASCGGGNSSNSSSPSQSVTSVVVSPSSASVPTGQTKQFTATVSGSQGVSQAVNWSVVGAGTINSSGLFTAGSSAGSATVMAVSQQDNAVSGTAAVTVSQGTVDAGNWYGSLTSSDGTQLYMTLDFNLTQQGNSLTASGLYDAYIPPVPSFVPNSCNPGADVSSGSGIAFGTLMSGTINGQSISLTYFPPAVNTVPLTQSIVLAGTIAGSTISGTFTSPQGATCLPVQSGSFSFQQYSMQQVNYTGNFTIGSSTVPFTLSVASLSNGGNYSGITIGSCPDYPAQSFSMNGQQWGRVFIFTPASVDPGSSPGVDVGGLLNDTAGQTATAFFFAAQVLNAFPNCLANEPVTSNQITLKAQ
jgi:hypothetical protein